MRTVSLRAHVKVWLLDQASTVFSVHLALQLPVSAAHQYYMLPTHRVQEKRHFNNTCYLLIMYKKKGMTRLHQ